MAKKMEFNMEVVKKYVFWICTPIGLIVAVLSGLMAIGSVADSLDKRKKELENQKSSTQTLRGTASTHANQGTIDSIIEEQEKLTENVFDAWEIMVRQQKERNRWEGLADGVIAEITAKNFLDTLTGTALNNYRDFAQNEINKLLDKNLARPGESELYLRRVQHFRRLADGSEEPLEQLDLTTSTGTGAGFGNRRGAFSRQPTPVAVSPRGGSGQTPDINTTQKGKVVWAAPQLDITMKNWQQTPLPHVVWLTQEDLWVYQALLWVVAESNKASREASRRGIPNTGGGTARSGDLLNLEDSVIKEIIELSIGKQAAVELQRQSSRRIGGGFGGMEGGSASESSTFGSGMGGGGMMGEGGGGAVTPEMARAEALAGRYVDAEGVPLATPDLTGQLRRMPVYLKFLVDQRRISEVLVNCANCPMPIDVLWVSVNPDAGQSFDYISSSAAGLGVGGSEGSSFGSFTRSGGRGSAASQGGRSGGRTAGASDVDFGPDAIIIEIFGCINIFAPPDAQSLEGGM